MIRNVAGQALYMIIVMIVLFYAAPAMFGRTYDYLDYPFYYDSSYAEELRGLPTPRLYHYTFLF
jgi:hypothetical protein